MSTAEGVKATVYSTTDVTILDTRAMAWEEFPNWTTPRVKVLARDDQGEVAACIMWMPPGLPPDLETIPYRHYHSTVSENFFFLSGELPHWDYRSEDDRTGVLVRFRE